MFNSIIRQPDFIEIQTDNGWQIANKNGAAAGAAKIM